MKKPAKRISADDVIALLRARHEPPAWAFLEQVRSTTGASSRERYADAIAMSLWPSRGIEVHGFEVKVSRSDVLKELRNPEKAAPIQRYCDRWWLVLADASLIQPGELPPTWGLMAVRGTTQLRSITAAPKLTPEAFAPGFVASVLRNFEQGYVPRREHDALKASVEAKAAECAEPLAEVKLKRLERELEMVKRDRDQLQKLHAKFNEQAGVELAYYTLGDISEAVKAVKAGGLDVIRARLNQVKNLGSALASEARHGLESLERQGDLAERKESA
jgi:hypothetical protein